MWVGVGVIGRVDRAERLVDRTGSCFHRSVEPLIPSIDRGLKSNQVIKTVIQAQQKTGGKGSSKQARKQPGEARAEGSSTECVCVCVPMYGRHMVSWGRLQCPYPA